MTQDNTLLVEQMLREATVAPEPGVMKQGKIISDGSKDLPLGVTTLTSAGYVFIYDTVTGEPSKINRNMLATKLKMRRPDGTFIFSLKQTVKPARGTYKCLLHADQPQRDFYSSIGLAVCRKDNLTSMFQVERHMQKRHQQEWATIKAERERTEKQEDREFQKSLIAVAGGKKSTVTLASQLPVSEEPVAVGATTATNEPELYISDKPAKPKVRRKKKK